MNVVDTELYLEPCKYYQNILKQAHLDNIDACLDELVKKSGIDVEGNKVTVEAYNKAVKESEEYSKKISKNNALSSFLLFLGILLAVAIIGIFILVYRHNTLKNKIKTLQEEKDRIDKRRDELLQEAKNQVAPLLALFDDEIAIRLAEKTAPLLDFDERCEPSRIERMVNQFGYEEDDDEDHSTLVVQSGELNGNPFVLKQTYVMNMYDEPFTGSLLITWTTVEHTENGSRTVTHTQTLYATIYKPVPHYSVQTTLTLTSDAAPKLSFSRSPAGMAGLSEKEVEKRVKKFEKEDQKRAEKAIKKGQSYTKMANSKFEAFLNSSDRNNEVEYRLLFTPLAQNNICYLFSQDKPYGDDINYVKNGCVNTIYSSHSMNMDYSGGAYNYTSYSYEEIKDKFTKYNASFFQAIYYDFLLYLSIPMFQQHSSAPYLGEGPKYARNVSIYEAEALVNKLEYETLKHKDSSTNTILKTTIMNKGKDYDEIEVEAHSYKAIPDIEYVPTMGGDGHMHMVPVPYSIYKPLIRTTSFTIYKNAVPKGTENNIMEYRKLTLVSKDNKKETK